MINKALGFGLALSVTCIAIVLISFFFTGHGTNNKAWTLDDSRLLTFSRSENTDASATLLDSTPEYTLEKVTYKSFGDTVYALLRIPANATKPPVVIVLPGATVNKESDAAMANELCAMGYASLTLDERGNNGETTGPSAMDINAGYNDYRAGKDPVQYKQVYDVLQGVDYIASRSDLDGSNVIVLGESMGGRFAIIAAAIDERLKGVVVVSSSQYGLEKGNDLDINKFITSIEPGSYVSKLPPRKLVMFHFNNDTIIRVDMAKQLYDMAGEPKSWHVYDGDVHGVYSDAYAGDLRSELREMFGR